MSNLTQGQIKSSMASHLGIMQGLGWSIASACEQQQQEDSLCFQANLIDLANILLLVVYLATLVIAGCEKRFLVAARWGGLRLRPPWLCLVASPCCAVLGVACVCLGALRSLCVFVVGRAGRRDDVAGGGETSTEPLLSARGGGERSSSAFGEAGFLSRLLFTWMDPLLRLGYSKPLGLGDVPPLDADDEAAQACDTFLREWHRRRSGGGGGGEEKAASRLVFAVLAACYKKDLLLTALYTLLRTAAFGAMPVMLYSLVSYSYRRRERGLAAGMALIAGLVVMKLVESLSQRHWFFGSRRLGMRMRSAAMAAVFEKQLRLSGEARRRNSAGEIVNYIAVDAYRLGEFPYWLHLAWSMPVQLALAVALLFWTVGAGALPGLVPVAACGVLNVPFAKLLQRYQSRFMAAQDERQRATAEALAAMKVVKLQSWEEFFRGNVQRLRDAEVRWLADAQVSKAYGSSLYWMSPTIISAVIFAGTAALRSAPLDAAVVFTILATLRVISEPMRMLPEVLSIMIQIKVSLDRIGKFLMEEFRDDAVDRTMSPLPMPSSDMITMAINNGIFSWEPSKAIATLKSINIAAMQGEKIAVCGPVGAGKSSLLCAMLGEIPRMSGSVAMSGSIAYVPQTPWIQSGTVRDNILFGKPMNNEEYDRAIRCCALDKDMENFPHGDLTEIGQRGLNMSGGQKQRIQLARAVYNGADVYLLDDPFSAVDAHTAATLFNVMENGEITQEGTYSELLQSGTAFEQLVNAHKDSKTILDTDDRREGAKELGAFQYQVPLIQQNSEVEISTVRVLRPAMPGNLLACSGNSEPTIQSLIAAHFGLKASREFFSGFMDSVFKAPMVFFDSTPTGRIMTRASSDLSILDFDIPFAMTFVISGSIEIATTIAIMILVTWQLVLVAIPVIVALLYIQRYYIASARELVRINGTTKAPVMNYAAESMLGVITIRAFAETKRFIQTNLQLIDTDATLFFYTNAALEWVLLRVEALQILVIVASSILLVLLPEGAVAPGFLGLCLSYALMLSSAQVFVTRFYSNLENYIISVERIKQFMHLPAEPPAVITDRRPPPSWPSAGRIELENLRVKYRQNAPTVLRGITCTFAAGHKIGVVGRTGSGKTTLLSTLFRLIDPYSGRILIDDLDICTIGLKDLRMKLSIIPQEPTLFRGSVRSNVDPLGLHTDEDIWEALDKCQLKNTISALPGLLESPVSDDGENWSAGQRQLFCLARVLLRRNKILVLDEATASIDSATDAVLQRVIKQEFSGCTVITIAHRVPTVTDSDMVMVLSYGKLIEYDRPSRLMENEDSAFCKLVAEYWSNYS
uniref:ABC transporter C family member 13 n=1 Tax=Oryza meridionalis TaxID=40149 RepID=A0A0E0DN41_9ORYZ